MVEHKSIHEAINAVMGEVGYVQKQRGANLTYTFAGEAALIQAIRPSMVEHGIYPSVQKIYTISREPYTTAKGTQMTNTVIHGVVRFAHVTGSFVDVEACGEGSDSGDKSANKAMTGLYKYAMRQTFCIETGDDPDKDASEERTPKAQKPPEKKETHPPSADEVDAQGAKAKFAKAFNAATKAGIKNLPTIEPNFTAAQINAVAAKIEAMMPEAK